MATIEIPFFSVLFDAPILDESFSESVGVYLSGPRKQALKEKFGWGTGLPKLSRESIPGEQLARADALRAAGEGFSDSERARWEKRADRAEICGRMAELFECGVCGKVFKRKWGCRLRSCPDCAKRIFGDAFAELLPLESHIPGALASLPGWGWKILDFTFQHDGEFPSREEMRKMRVVINRVTDRVMREKCASMFFVENDGQSWPVAKCRLRFQDGQPVMFDGWPVVSAPDGSAHVLRGWVALIVGRVGKRPTCLRCGSRVKKIKGELAKLCPKCGPVLWPDWENQEVDGRRWRLRFGLLQVAVSEFGYRKETGSPNSNYHFHSCYFGPFLDWARLVEIFRGESRKALGVESRVVLIAKAQRGYRSALAHALKYTAKVPATTPEGLAIYEKLLLGVRRYTVRGFLQGVPLKKEKRGEPECPMCETKLKRVVGLGIVPLSEVEDIPFLPEEKSDYLDSRQDDEFCFLEPEELASPRAPC